MDKHATHYLHIPQEGVGRFGAETENRLVIGLPAFLRLAPAGLKTIYTATEEAPHTLLGRYTSLDFGF